MRVAWAVFAVIVAAGFLVEHGHPQTMYRWVDEHGNVHFSQTLEGVPERHRSGLQPYVPPEIQIVPRTAPGRPAPERAAPAPRKGPEPQPHTAAGSIVGPASGVPVPALAAIDAVVTQEMQRLRIPGGAVAIVKDGRLVFARGYGVADVVSQRPVAVTSLFRIGSVSKPVTAVGVMKLIEDGRLTLDSRPFEVLKALPAMPGAAEDPRLTSITVRHLLTHTAGWDGATRAVDTRVWKSLWDGGRTAPRTPAEAFRIGRAEPLVAHPGTRVGYTNYAFQTLGRIIEHVTGTPYETYMRERIFAPIGITRIRFGVTPASGRGTDEVSYYDPRPPTRGPYGSGSWPDVGGGMEYYEASGSWLASAIDMMRLITAVEGSRQPSILSRATASAMFAGRLGWFGDASAVHHGGAADGGDGLLVRQANGIAYVALFNVTRDSHGRQGRGTMDAALRRVINSIPSWPAHDLFTRYE